MGSDQCALCGLPVRLGGHGDTIRGKPFRFCCTGCRMVFSMLMEASDHPDPLRFKQTDLYRRCLAAGVIPAAEADLDPIEPKEPSNPAGKPFGASPSSGLALDLEVTGMWCPACAWVIEDGVRRTDGVLSVRCDFATDALYCRYDPVRTAPDAIVHRIRQLGYGTESDDRRTETRPHGLASIRLIVSLVLSANIMMLSWALYSGFFTEIPAQGVAFISWPIAVLATWVVGFGGGPIFRRAWAGIKSGSPGMESMIALGAVSAYLYSLGNLLAGSIHLYFDTAAMLIALSLLGKMIEDRAKAGIRRDLKRFMTLKPRKVRLCGDTAPDGRFMSIDHLAVGDTFNVRAGEVAPADGRIQGGQGQVDTSAITGESRPRTLGSGDKLMSGYRVVQGDLLARAEAIGDNTLLGQMIDIVRQSLARKTPFEGKTDRLLTFFAPTMALLAMAAGVAVFWGGAPLHQAVVRGVTVLVIACPCALGIAIPLARVAGIAGAGRLGILVREFEAFERLAGIDTLVFDKTGTLTHGRWCLEQVAAETLDIKTCVALAYGLETGVDHAVARAVASYAHSHKVSAASISDRTVFPDGVSGVYNGRPVRFGRRVFALTRQAKVTGRVASKKGESEWLSRVYLSLDGRLAAVFYFGDALKPGMAGLTASLKAQGYQLHLVSGDTRAATKASAKAVRISRAEGRLSPEEKSAYVAELQARGRHVLMVGDGVNDAPALARADVSVAVYSGAAFSARETADITLMRGDPRQLMDLKHWSVRVNRKIQQNVWCAFVYNLVGIPIAMSGLLTPLVAVTAMLLSSLTVIGNTVLLVGVRSEKGELDQDQSARKSQPRAWGR